MKKILSLTLASAMVMSMTVGAVAATADHPVGEISSIGYAFDSDLGAVDLTIANPDFSYGDTIYYPMINKIASAGNTAIEAARTALAGAVTVKEGADAALVIVEATAETEAAELLTATTRKTKTAELVVLANAWKDAIPANAATAEAAYVALATELSVEIKSDSTDAVTGATTAAGTASTEFDTAKTNSDNADLAVIAAEGLVATEVAAVKVLQEALDTLLSTTTQFVHESDAVDNIKVRDSWEMNGKLVEDVTVIKKKINVGYVPAEKYIYFVAVDLEESDETDEEDINGLVELRKSGDDGFEYEDMTLEVNIEVGFPEATDDVITKSAKIFSNGNGFNDDSEDELTFEVDEDSYFTVNTMGQGELLLSMSSRFNSDVAARFPDANLDFLKGNGGSFNKIGMLSISAPKDSFIYKLSDDGTLTLIETDYDEYDEVHNFKTRSLDSYVISDIELEGTEAPDVTPDEDGTVTPDDTTDGNVNPNTGAKA